MNTIRKTLILLASLAVASIAMNTTLSAGSANKNIGPDGTYCINSGEELKQQTAQKGLNFIFAGISRNGIPLWFYTNDDAFTVFYLTPEGKYCTSPNFFGDIIETASTGDKT